MSDADLTVREACRQRVPLDGTDAQALENALTITERERDEARIECGALRIWASMRACANYIEGVWVDGQPECGECVPCKARAELKGMSDERNLPNQI